MRLAGRMICAQLRVLADHACLARDGLVALDLALAARIAGLQTCQPRLLAPSRDALAGASSGRRRPLRPSLCPRCVPCTRVPCASAAGSRRCRSALARRGRSRTARAAAGSLRRRPWSQRQSHLPPSRSMTAWGESCCRRLGDREDRVGRHHEPSARVRLGSGSDDEWPPPMINQPWPSRPLAFPARHLSAVHLSIVIVSCARSSCKYSTGTSEQARKPTFVSFAKPRGPAFVLPRLDILCTTSQNSRHCPHTIGGLHREST
jgi:hypothetical protein